MDERPGQPCEGPGAGRDASPARGRVVIEQMQPQIDAGRFPVRRTVGERVLVRADAFADGHDRMAGVLRYRRAGASWCEVPLDPLGNDAWSASFVVAELGEYEYTIEAWIDRFGTWLAALVAKADAGQDVESELLEGAEIVERAASLAVRLKPDTTHDDDRRLRDTAEFLRRPGSQGSRVAAASDPGLRGLMDARPDREASTVAQPLRVVVDRERARFGAWYEMFPRSCTSDPARGGTFRDAEGRLPDIAAMGFDVLYLPPVHPIGSTNRKGRNNALVAAPGDPGSPWAIGSEAGGHTAVDPALGTLDDFDRFVATAAHLGLEVALDIAFQASPDHPWTRTHPDWFRQRPDGSIKHAENPPKKYEDIYPFNFDTRDWRSLWEALRDVFLFWASHGIRIFRVDNPHTKPFAFWEWAIADVRRRHPDTIFLSEAFTRPKVMRYLAKVGFNQSYTYFTWRNAAQELREYLTEISATEPVEYFRPNFFTNTPDILNEYLQSGGRAAFEVRLILAATLSASYGIYSGFELCENVPIRGGSEEYMNSEKYEIRVRNWNQPGRLNELIARVNEIRHEYAALQFNQTLAFHGTDNPALLWFSKTPPVRLKPDTTGSPVAPAADVDWHSRVFVVANTDPHRAQSGGVQVPLGELGLHPDGSYVVEDLLDGARYTWRGEWNFVKLDPAERMAHIFVVRDHQAAVRTR